ncbi:MAG: adenylyltransferase/riboflavin kinase [Actinomycetota bacterium]
MRPAQIAFRTVEVITDLSIPSWGDERSVITIGMYDGVHLGHRTVIKQVRQRAAELGARSVVVTFDRHPMSIVRPESAPKLLTNLEQRLELLAGTGVDATVVVSFNDEQSHETAVGFVERVIVGALRTKAVIVGSDFHFGHMRQGNVTLLREMGERHDFTAEPMRLVPRADGVDEPVSSTAIRRALAGGEIDTATRMLGRPHEIRGTVIDGDKRGRTIGFPTANVAVPDGMCIPADGVYAAVYRRPDGSEHPAAVNIGRRPTFYNDAQHSLIEAHLIDFAGDVYGEPAAVQFLAFLRSEKRFAGIDELKNQLVSDIEHARNAVLARRGRL